MHIYWYEAHQKKSGGHKAHIHHDNIIISAVYHHILTFCSFSLICLAVERRSELHLKEPIIHSTISTYHTIS